MKIKEGEQLPNSEFYYLDSSGAAKKISTAEVFKNHKTIIIGVPGAFTKVCSAKHLPGYVNNIQVSLNELNKIGQRLVEVQGQFDNHSLLDSKEHLSLLDQFGGY